MTLRESWRLFRQFPDLVGRWCDRRIMELHRMVALDPTDPQCWACNRPWPCDHYARAADRLAAEHGRVPVDRDPS